MAALSVRRVARRDRRSSVKMLALPSDLQAHDDLLPVGREARRERHAGIVADRLALAAAVSLTLIR